MNFLTPLYLLGALAIVAPIVFHLIRPDAEGRDPVLVADVPRTVAAQGDAAEPDRPLAPLAPPRRGAGFAGSGIRAAVLAGRGAQVDLGDAESRRVLVLIDTSASMRRGDLWAEAKKKATNALAAARPGDPLTLFAFDTAPRALMTFAEAAALDPAARLALAQSRLAALTPTWKGTELGTALGEAVAAIADGADRDAKAGRVPRRIVLISDLQAGSHVEALGDLAWPSDVELELQPVKLPGGNAGIEALADAPALAGALTTGSSPSNSADGPAARVRVTSDPASKTEAFQVGWVDLRTKAVIQPIEVYVPPGESRVVRIPVPPVDPKDTPDTLTPSTLRLTGDRFPFDNSAYVAVAPRAEVHVAFLGPDAANDPNGLLYYLNRVFDVTPRRTVRVEVNPVNPDPKNPPSLVVVASELAPDRAGMIRRQVEAGASALVVANRAGEAPTLATLLGVPGVEWTESPDGRDALLGEIAFDHPTFAPLAGPQFNDFTKIRFWKHRRATDPDQVFAGAQILAKFDDGAPALVEKPVGQGRVLVLASGWNPRDSQLARSSKFVPLMASLLDRRGTASGEPKRYQVGDRVILADLGMNDKAEPVEILTPDGATIKLEPGAEAFTATGAPGIYSARLTRAAVGPPRPFAVNLDPAESRTEPLASETLEQLGVRLAGSTARAELDAEALRQMQTAELEGRQKLWRWIVLAAIAFLIGETWLAGRVDRARLPRPASAPGI